MCTCVKVFGGVIHLCFYLDQGGTYGVTMVLGPALVILITQAALQFIKTSRGLQNTNSTEYKWHKCNANEIIHTFVRIYNI